MSLPEHVPTAVVNLDKPRRVAFTLGAMRRIKEATGFAIDDEAPRRTTDVLGAYIWAMLVKEDREGLTVEDVEDMLHPGNLEEITNVFHKLVGLSAGENGGKAPAAAPDKLTLISSGPSELETLDYLTNTSGV